ncbi:MAG TPA: hypothetical protein VNB49_17395 [Candidatus Dormibacteraeota bacterium]|nr:hypothetical protein [Candidatus Dormibacteraeota bacterium]
MNQHLAVVVVNPREKNAQAMHVPGGFAVEPPVVAVSSLDRLGQ